jgi:hypothetical protein
MDGMKRTGSSRGDDSSGHPGAPPSSMDGILCGRSTMERCGEQAHVCGCLCARLLGDVTDPWTTLNAPAEAAPADACQPPRQPRHRSSYMCIDEDDTLADRFGCLIERGVGVVGVRASSLRRALGTPCLLVVACLLVARGFFVGGGAALDRDAHTIHKGKGHCRCCLAEISHPIDPDKTQQGEEEEGIEQGGAALGSLLLVHCPNLRCVLDVVE